MTYLEQAIASGQVSADQIEAHRAAFDVEAAIARMKSYVPSSTANGPIFETCLRDELLAAYAAGAQSVQPAEQGDAKDAERLDWLCEVRPRRVEQITMGLFRAYEDTATRNQQDAHWNALTKDYKSSAREAIDAAIASKGTQT